MPSINEQDGSQTKNDQKQPQCYVTNRTGLETSKFVIRNTINSPTHMPSINEQDGSQTKNDQKQPQCYVTNRTGLETSK